MWLVAKRNTSNPNPLLMRAFFYLPQMETLLPAATNTALFYPSPITRKSHERIPLHLRIRVRRASRQSCRPNFRCHLGCHLRARPPIARCRRNAGGYRFMRAGRRNHHHRKSGLRTNRPRHHRPHRLHRPNPRLCRRHLQIFSELRRAIARHRPRRKRRRRH